MWGVSGVPVVEAEAKPLSEAFPLACDRSDVGVRRAHHVTAHSREPHPKRNYSSRSYASMSKLSLCRVGHKSREVV